MDAPTLAPTPPTSTTKTKRTITRLNSEGHKLLEDFYNNVTPRPTTAQRRSLLNQIHSMAKEHATYREGSLAGWFFHRRKKDSDALPEANAAGSSLFPTIQEKSIPLLNTLLKSTPNPPPDLVEAWALLLPASPTDIMAWIQVHRTATTAPDPTSHLPTPSISQSPEPLSMGSARSSPDFKSEASTSPTMTFAPSPSFLLRPFIPTPPPISAVVEGGPSFLPSPPPASPTATDPILSILSRVLTQDRNTQSTRPLPNLPSSAAAFSAAFAPYEEDMNRALAALKLVRHPASNM
ncbi:hypothetical protein HGRIS_001874 [Hohenbuehelia grisea]|uniref:Homeobox domain-containing protein n=1 Tax=Hohenbuehelia grisea TaxID=104357 RepID=A0ABR3JJ62_9AGAR